jgi:hypothetical protein
MRGGELVWDSMALGTRFAFVLLLPTAIVSGAAIRMIRLGTGPGSAQDLKPTGSRPTLWPALTLLACAPFVSVVFRMATLDGDSSTNWWLPVGAVMVLALVATAAVTLARRSINPRQAPRSRGLVVTGAVMLTLFGTAASYEFGPVVLAPLLVERGAIAEPPVLAFLLLASVTTAAIWMIRVGEGPDQDGRS